MKLVTTRGAPLSPGARLLRNELVAEKEVLGG